MARRGVMTALQAALAGIGGAAGGYVQMEDRKRKQQMEDEERKRRQALEEAGIRAEQRDILRSGGTQIAGLGEAVAGPVPSVIPLSGVGNAFATAEAAGGPATSRGALRQEVGGQSFLFPGAAEQEETALRRSLRVTEETGALKSRQDREAFDVTNRGNFEVYKQAYGGRGEYNPQMNYERLLTVLGSQATNRTQRAIAAMRVTGAGGGGRAGGAQSRAEKIATLPTVSITNEALNKLTDDDVKKLSGFGVSAAAQVPKILTSSRGGFSQLAALPIATLYSQGANQEERQYAEYIRSITDAVASMVTVGVMTDYDVARFENQVAFNPGDSPTDKVRKFNNLRSWSAWLQSGGEGKYPGETTDQYVQRTSMLRARPGANMQAAQQQGAGATPAPADAQTERERQAWDTLAAQYGEAAVRERYGERP